jgi:putative SOS response-associated peptidase YedK
MCGRYSFAPDVKTLSELFKGLELPDALEQNFNIAPTQRAWVITNQAPSILSPLAWGIYPAQTKHQSSLRHINARAETILEKKSFENAVHHRRCLVPADSFYEWKRLTEKQKQPYRILRKDGELLIFAGIWQSQTDQEGKRTDTFAIITTTPNQEMATIHDRMPVILNTADDRATWISDAPTKMVLPLLVPAPDGTLRTYPVHQRIGQHMHNDATLHEEVPMIKTLFD